MQSPATFNSSLIPDVQVPVMDIPSDGAGRIPATVESGPADLARGESAARRIRADVASPASFMLRRIASAEELSALADGWNRLAGDIPFRRWDWLATWWRHYSQPAAELCVLAVENDEGELVGLAPWYIEPTAGQGRVIRFLGSGEICSEYLTVLSHPGFETDVAGTLCTWLCDEGAESWDLIELIGAEVGDPGIRALTDEFLTREFVIHERPGMDCWSVALPPTWDEFVATLNSSRRAKVRQALRKHFDNHQATIHLLADPAELDCRFEMIVDLHQRRHQGLGQPGCFASRRFTDFHREISRRLLALGKLRLMWTELAGQPIAAEYDLVGGDTIYYYQTGIEPAAIKVGPGWLGMIGSLKQAIEAGYRNFDFLRGDEAYKVSWGAQPRQTVETRIVARRATPRFRHAVWLARINVRRWMKQGFLLGRKIARETD